MNMNFTYLRQEEESLKKEQKQIRYGAYFTIGLLVAVILISVLKYYYLTLLSLALVLFLQLFYFRGKRKDYQEHIQRVNLLTVVGGLLNCDKVEEKGGAGLSVETLRKAELLSYQNKGKEVNFYLGMKGSYEKLEVTTADAAIVQFYGGDSHKAEINCGNWTHIRLPKDSGLDIRILDRNVMRLSTLQQFFDTIPSLKEQAAEEWNLPENFLLYQKEDSEGNEEKRLPEQFLNRLSELSSYTPGKIAISIRGREMDVYIRNRFLGRNFPMNAAPTEQMISSESYPELEKILKLAAAVI